MRKLIFSILSLLFFFGIINAEIITTDNIQDIQKEITEDSLVLINIDNILMNTETSLGNQAWRKYFCKRLDRELFRNITSFIFECIPPKSPEPSIIQLIKELQSKEINFCFISRGRLEASQFFLNTLGINCFSHPDEEFWLHPYAVEHFSCTDVIYATKDKKSEEILLERINREDPQYLKIVFIDNNTDLLVSVERTLGMLNIPFVGFEYSRIAIDYSRFDPLVATIQFHWLITYNQLLMDNEAIQFKNQFLNVDPNQYFEDVINKYRELLKLD